MEKGRDATDRGNGNISGILFGLKGNIEKPATLCQAASRINPDIL
jgi:hypothetical protein